MPDRPTTVHLQMIAWNLLRRAITARLSGDTFDDIAYETDIDAAATELVTVTPADLAVVLDYLAFFGAFHHHALFTGMDSGPHPGLVEPLVDALEEARPDRQP